MEQPDKTKSKVSMMAIKSQSTTRSLANIPRRPSTSSKARMKERRQSFGFSSVAGIRPLERTSQVAMEFKRPQLSLLPTYQLEPHELWNNSTVKVVTEEILNEHFTGHKYNLQLSPALAPRIALELMRRVKALNFNRYRVIAVVTIGQKRAQSYNNAISFIWDHERDNYYDTQREETTAFLQATVFGIYLD